MSLSGIMETAFGVWLAWLVFASLVAFGAWLVVQRDRE